MTSSPLLTHVSSLVSLGYSPRFSSLFILIMSQLNIMRPFVYKPRPFLSYFASLYKEEQKEILKTLTLYVMRKEDQSEDDIIKDIIEDIFNNHKGELNEEERSKLKFYQSLPKNFCSLSKEKKTTILLYIFKLRCNYLHKDDQLKIFNFLDGVEEEVIFHVDDDNERKKIKDIIIKKMETFFFERSIAVYESREKKNDKKQEEWTIDCSLPADTAFTNQLRVICKTCLNDYSIRSIKRHALALHDERGTVDELATFSRKQWYPKKKREGEQEVKRLQVKKRETYRVNCRKCKKELSNVTIKNHALNKHKEAGTVKELSTPVKR